MVLARGRACASAASNAPNCYSRDRSCAWFTAYILICSHGLSYHRIKYVNVPVEGSLWQRHPRLNTISLNEATQSAFTTDTDSSLFGTSSVGLFGCLFMPLCEWKWASDMVCVYMGYIRGVSLHWALCVCTCVIIWLFLVCVCLSGTILCTHIHSKVVFVCIWGKCVCSICVSCEFLLLQCCGPFQAQRMDEASLWRS